MGDILPRVGIDHIRFIVAAEFLRVQVRKFDGFHVVFAIISRRFHVK